MDKTEYIADPFKPVANARHPLLGVTILLIEDSRFCSEAVRLLSICSGARLRRADSLRAARRHLAGYRPAVVMVDLGLPDGSGLEIIEEMAAWHPKAPIILATSGEDTEVCKSAAMAAGADDFIAKPLKNLREFEKIILRHLPGGQKLILKDVPLIQPDVQPDQLALREDLGQISQLLKSAEATDDVGALTYCAQFLRSVADVAKDAELLECAYLLSARLSAGLRAGPVVFQTMETIGQRLQNMQTD